MRKSYTYFIWPVTPSEAAEWGIEEGWTVYRVPPCGRGGRAVAHYPTKAEADSFVTGMIP